MSSLLTRWKHRLGLRNWHTSTNRKWANYVDYPHYPPHGHDEHCHVCGAWNEVSYVDDSPWGVRTRSEVRVTLRKAWSNA